MQEADDGRGPAHDPVTDETIELLLRAAERNGMVTGSTDWHAVARAAARARGAAALLAKAAEDRPLRAVPPQER
jgi:hypothetical protein